MVNFSLMISLKRKPGSLFLLALLLLAPVRAAAEGPQRTELIVAAAASLQDALQEFKVGYEKSHPAIRLTFVFGASGQLQKQLVQGAPYDLFISAAPEYVDTLEKAGELLPGARRDLLGNELVLIVPATDTSMHDISELKNPAVKKIALGEPGSVPAGKYAQATLQSLGLQDSLKDRLIYALNVRQVLDYVGRGEANAGFVYRSDAQGNGKVRVVATAPAGSHPPIIYPGAVAARTPFPDAARALLAALADPSSLELFKRYGFRAPPEPVKK